MNAAEDKAFREFEGELDRHHESLPLWNTPRGEAVYSVLTIPDSIFLILMTSPTPPYLAAASAQRLKGTEEGMAQAIRWLCADGQTAVTPTSNFDQIKIANDFAMYAEQYVNIADFHMMLGRGLVSADVDIANKSVKFNTIQGPGMNDAVAWHEMVRDQGSRGLDMATDMNIEAARRSREIFNTLTFELANGRIVMGDFPPNLVSRVREILLPTQNMEQIPLPLSEDMIGFTLQEYWSFALAVETWSYGALFRYLNCARTGTQQHLCMPTQIVDINRFLTQVSGLSGLSESTVSTVLSRLTYVPSKKSDILLTPFLRDNDKVAWSPAMITKMNHQRNLLKIMARGPKNMQDRAATINGARDRPLARLIAGEFNERGYQFKIEEGVKAAEEETDVDILLWLAAQGTEVLVIEAKAILGADEINEVNSAGKVMRIAQDQVKTAIRILKALSDEEKQRKFKFVPWNRIRSYYGVVITSESEPHSPIDPNEVPVISLNTLYRRMRNRDFRSPERFFNACLERPWLKNEIQTGEQQHLPVKVGQLTYLLPATSMSSTPNDLDLKKMARLMTR